VGHSVYKITLESSLKPGEYAFFLEHRRAIQYVRRNMGSAVPAEAPAAGIYDFAIPE
jgi:hypothetical protein